MNTNDYILSNYSGIDDGDTVKGCTSTGCYRVDERGEHPSSCELNVRREGEWLIFNCFSGSCPCGKGGRGCVKIGGRKVRPSDNSSKPRPVKPNYAVPRGCVSTFPRHVIAYLEDNHIPVKDARNYGFVWHSDKQQLIYPLTKDGKNGYVFRVLKPNVIDSGEGKRSYIKTTKWLRHFDKLTLPSFKGETEEVYVAESLLSAVVGNIKNLSTIASLGVNMDEDKVRQIRKICKQEEYKGIVLCPDPDVSRGVAITAKRKLLAGSCPSTTITRYNKKPRDEWGNLWKK